MASSPIGTHFVHPANLGDLLSTPARYVDRLGWRIDVPVFDLVATDWVKLDKRISPQPVVAGRP